MIAQSMLSFSSLCVKSNEALKKRNRFMSIETGATNNLVAEENWKTRIVIPLYNTFCLIQNVFFMLTNFLFFFSVMELWVPH